MRIVQFQDPLSIPSDNTTGEINSSSSTSANIDSFDIELSKVAVQNVADILLKNKSSEDPETSTSVQRNEKPITYSKNKEIKNGSQACKTSLGALTAKRNDDHDDVTIVESNEVVIDLCEETMDIDNETTNDLSGNQGSSATASKTDLFSLTPENITMICRICLKEKDVLNMNQSRHEGHTITEILEMCSSIKLQEDLTLSQNICEYCLEQLLHAYHFREKCVKSEQTLVNFKAELERSQKRMESARERTRCLTLRFHDYENILNEEEVSNITNVTKHKEEEAKQAVKKRFYLLKGNLKGKEGFTGDVNVTEIDETNAITLINENGETAVSLKVGNAICNIKPALMAPGQDENNILSNASSAPHKSLIIRGTGKRRIIPYSQIIRPALNSILYGRISNLNTRILKKKKPKRKRNADKVPKPKDKKVVIPGVCEVCNEPYSTMEEYKLHAQATKHYVNPYVCKSCGKIYPDKHRLKIHWNINHETKRSHMCEICGKCYKTRSYLLIHLKSHTQKKYVCRICRKAYPSLKDIVRHRKLTHPNVEKTHCCEYCGEFFGRPDTLRHHRNRIHLQIQRQFCQICGKGYQYKSTLKKHMASHSTQQFNCKLCNKSFKVDYRYQQHIKTQHPGADENTSQEDEIQLMECDYCNKLCRNKQLQSMHIAEEHEVAMCIYCDAVFEFAEDLANHIKDDHTDIIDYSCRYCGKCFTESHMLYSHLDVHRARYYQCHICFKKFVTNVRLKIHMVIHTREKLYECQYCDKSFLYNTSRIIHERLHTGERPYVCDVCGKGSVCNSSHKRHRRTHFIFPPSEELIQCQEIQIENDVTVEEGE